MPGLLDITDDPNTAGLLSLGLRLMSTPGKFGTALGQAGLGAMGDLQQARQMVEQRKLREQQAKMQGLQMQSLEQQLADAKRAREEAQRQAERDDAFRRSIPSPQAQALQSLGADASPTLANAARLPQVDPRTQLLFDALQTRQIKAMDYLTATQKDRTPIKLGKDDRLLDPITNRVLVHAMPDPSKDTAPSDWKLYQLSGAPQRGLSFDQWDLTRRRANATSVNVNTADNKFDAKAAEVVASQFAETYKQGQAATRALGQVNRLDDLLKKTGGGFTPAIKVYAGQFGVNTSGLDDLQAAEAVIQSLIPQQRPPGSGTMSDRDVELFRQSLPRLINQPGGNQKIVNTMRGLYEYDRKLGQISSDALAGKISRDRAIELMNAVPNPLADLTGGEDIHSRAEAVIRGAGNGKR